MSDVQERPKVTVRPNTANTIDVIIHTDNGDVRLLAGHDRIIVNAIASIDIEVHP